MLHSWYYDLQAKAPRPETTVQFVLGSLLKARIECGFESDPASADEEVNVYLVHLLSQLIASPNLGELTGGDVDVFRKIRDSLSDRFKCEVYRANADQLLVATGIFTDTPYENVGGTRTYASTARDRIGRGKAYYHYAAAYQEQMRAGSVIVARLLARLSSQFERYVDVLFYMRGEYFNLYDKLCSENLAALQGAPSGGSDVLGVGGGDSLEPGSSSLLADDTIAELRDQFLDAYWAWQQEPTTTNHERLVAAVDRLQAADPDFDFRQPPGH
jgi:hypothetical protein